MPPLLLTLEDNTEHSANTINGVIISKTSDICECGVFVGGSEHGCDKCNRKMHNFCGTGIGQPGFGQPRRCNECAKTVSLDVTTKPKPGRPKKNDIPAAKRRGRKKISHRLDIISPPNKNTGAERLEQPRKRRKVTTAQDKLDEVHTISTVQTRSKKPASGEATSHGEWYKQYGI